MPIIANAKIISERRYGKIAPLIWENPKPAPAGAPPPVWAGGADDCVGKFCGESAMTPIY